MPFKVIVVILLSLVVAAGVGWFVGASGRAAIELERHRAEMRATYAEARALALDGRVSVHLSNFGDAVERFQGARTLVGRLQLDLRELGQSEQAGRLETVLSHLADAQRATAAFDAAQAETSAGLALDALQATLGGG